MTQTRLRQVATEIAGRLIDERERYQADELDRLIAEELRDPALDVELREEITLRASRDVRREIERARQPKWNIGDEQISMFDPDALLVLGDGERVHMQFTTQADMIAWGEVDRRDWQGKNDAYSARQAYRNERQQAWLNRSDLVTLGQLERAEFGWS